MASKTTRRPRTSSTSSPRSAKLPSDSAQFRRFASQLQVEDGSALALYPEQFEMLEPYFDGASETVILVPKKCGKSTLIAAVALYHLLTTPFATCIVVAAARQQAEIILGQVKMFIRQSPALRSRMKVLNREVESLIDGGKIEVRASDVDTLDGLIPTLAIVDELHRHRTGDVRGSLRLGLGPRGGKMLTISTAGASVASPLGILRQRAYLMPGFTRDKELRRSFVRSESGSFAFIEWSLNPDDDPNDLEVVKLVNPAPWRTLEALANEKDAVTEWEWLRLICNVWTEGDEPWLPAGVWDALPETSAIEKGSDVVLGIRVGQGHTSAALVWVQSVDGIYQVGYELVTSGGLQAVEERVRELNERYSVRFNAYVSKTFDRSAEMLSEEGLTMVAYPIGTRTMDMAETLLKVIGEKRLAHEGVGAFRTQVLAGQVKIVESGWKFVDVPNATVPIDALLALAAAVHTAETTQVGEPMFGFG